MTASSTGHYADDPVATPAPAAIAERRVDAAHRAANQPQEAESSPTAPAAHPPEALAELARMRVQATQLARHLKQMRDELDRRESELNARGAALDNQLRSARLWAEERDFELSEQARLLEEREQVLAEAAAVPTPAAVSADSPDDDREARLATRLRKIAEREEALSAEADRLARQEEAIRHTLGLVRQERAAAQADFEHRQADLDRWRGELELKAASLDELHRQVLTSADQRATQQADESADRTAEWQAEAKRDFEAHCQRITSELEARGQFLEDSEVLLAEGQAALEQDRERLDADRREFERAAQAGHEQLATRQRQLESEWTAREEALTRRQEQLDAREAAVSQLRQDVSSMHRESLEMRLATEELYSSMLEDAPPAQLTHQLSQIRAKLSDHYRLAETEVETRREELEVLCERLSKQRDRLAREKSHFKQWLAACEQQIEEQAGQLSARQRELDEQETAISRHSEAWEAERRTYQHEIRRLLAVLRGGGRVLAAA